MKIQHTLNKFISKSRKIHGDAYVYDEVTYINCKTKVKIFCKRCNKMFLQTPHKHTQGQGCPYCARKKKSNVDIINEFIKIHGDIYDYSLVEYVHSKMKVKIICKKHGVFLQTPDNHKKGKGCPKCNKKHKKTTDEFINECKKIHGETYDYSKTEYINNKTKVIVICKKHGEFTITPSNHLSRRSGCPKCKKSKSEHIISEYLKNKNIQFFMQHQFADCKGKKKPLLFDFYLPEYNMCIEFDGEQHYKRYRFEKDDKRLTITKLRDQIKDEYCKRKNIKLIRIKYDQNITAILDNVLS